MNLTTEQLQRAQAAIDSGYIASRFAMEHWEMFCEWAARLTPDTKWLPDDRNFMDADSQILFALGTLDE